MLRFMVEHQVAVEHLKKDLAQALQVQVQVEQA
jgi:hypothetical protein